jgi:hypothetical protein
LEADAKALQALVTPATPPAPGGQLTPSDELVIPNLSQKQGVDPFKGAENDTISMKVDHLVREHLVRGIKLQLDGTSDYPIATGGPARTTAVSDAKVWTPVGIGAETDPAKRLSRCTGEGLGPGGFAVLS